MSFEKIRIYILFTIVVDLSKKKTIIIDVNGKKILFVTI